MLNEDATYSAHCIIPQFTIDQSPCLTDIGTATFFRAITTSRQLSATVYIVHSQAMYEVHLKLGDFEQQAGIVSINYYFASTTNTVVDGLRTIFLCSTIGSSCTSGRSVTEYPAKGGGASRAL